MAAIDKFLRLMAEKGASDLHMPCGSPPMMRVHGELQRVNYRGLEDAELQPLLEEIMPPRCLKEFRESRDTDFIYELAGVGRFRSNAFVQRHGTSAVFRLIPQEVLTADQLGLPAAIRAFASLPKGLVLVTGPTGSGKSTTLAAIVDLVNEQRKDHILTIEDPIEFVHKNKNCLVSQRQVGDHTGDFAKALRQALREDPDVILVGEMRDLETIELAITAAETGHLVFGTLHTTSAPKTVDRVIDAFPSEQQEQIRTMLSESLRGVVAQVLLKRIDKPGRVAALEILIGGTALANLVREGKTFQIPSLLQTSKGVGMQSMDQALLDLCKRRIIDPKDAVLHAMDKRAFEPMLGGGIGSASAPAPGSGPYAPPTRKA
jgi:twitching motility protein PilT